MNLSDARRRLQQKQGRKIELEDSIEQTHIKVKREERQLVYLEQAHEIIRQVGYETQQQLQYHIADIASVALEGVFDEPYKVVLDFVERRSKIECDILFERDGELIDPMSASGGGVVDLVAFALRIASWSMKVPRTRNVIMLDEPFKHLSKDLHHRASEMVKQVSKRLGVQFIIITHETTLGLYADKVFEVKQQKGISIIKEQ